MHPSEPVIYSDRMAVVELASKDASVRDALAEWNVGKVDKRDRVHFCGMVRLDSGRTAVFLPRGSSQSVPAAALTMKTLSRFGRDSTNRDFISEGDTGNSGILAVIASLADDFHSHGLFRERQRIRSRNTGKPDWQRTISRERSFVVEDGSDIYPNIATTRVIDSNDTLLAQIQTVVMEEILVQHGWWLGESRSRRNELRWCQRPPYLRVSRSPGQ